MFLKHTILQYPVCLIFVQCFDTVGWVTGGASDLKKSCTSMSPNVLLSAIFDGPGLAWSDLQKNRLAKRKSKVVQQSVCEQHDFPTERHLIDGELR